MLTGTPPRAAAGNIDARSASTAARMHQAVCIVGLTLSLEIQLLRVRRATEVASAAFAPHSALTRHERQAPAAAAHSAQNELSTAVRPGAAPASPTRRPPPASPGPAGLPPGHPPSGATARCR